MKPTSQRPLIASGVLLGVGMGGFVDGIVFHQLLQFHNMLSSVYPPTSVVNLEVNMFWDGLFHVSCWLMTALGIAMLWRTVQRREAELATPILLGATVLGWGLFNLVEGLIDHVILQIHHVREVSDPWLWDGAFLASGVLFALLGWMLIRKGIRQIGAGRR